MNDRIIVKYGKTVYFVLLFLSAFLITIGIVFYTPEVLSEALRSWLFIVCGAGGVIVSAFRLSYEAVFSNEGVTTVWLWFIKRSVKWSDVRAKRIWRTVRRETVLSTRNNGARVIVARLYVINGMPITVYSEMKGFDLAVEMIKDRGIKDK
ncbi:MAG: hypothetical protein IJQ53_01565 [Clostridia bacterium]|nr:hypothetical protein [Clostridia bacterium]